MPFAILRCLCNSRKGNRMKKLYLWFRHLLAKLFLRECHYVGSSDVLPPPLDPEHEEALIANLQDEQARQTLIEHNLRLVVYISKKFENTGVSLEDLTSIGTIGLIKAVDTFDASKGPRIATYASRCIENATLTRMGF